MTLLQQQKVEELLMSYGWQFFDKCQCGGTLRNKYKSKNQPGYNIRIMPRKDAFDVIRNGSIISTGRLINGSLFELETELKKYETVQQ